LLYKGIRTKEDYFYLQKKIAEVQSLADKAINLAEYKHMKSLIERKGDCSRN